MSEIDAIDALFGKPGEPVPVVDVADIKKVWAFGRELRARHPEGVAVELGVLQKVCPGVADVRAVAYRGQRWGIFEWLMRAAWTGGELSENAFKVAARMDLVWIAPGVSQKGLFELEDFVGQVFAEEQRLRPPEKAV
jgi:hypothetical protein